MRHILLNFLALIMLCSFANAEKWNIVGARALAMGGAGVAVARGPEAQYWNPAALMRDNDVNDAGLLISAGTQIEATEKVLSAVNKITDLADRYEEVRDIIKSSDGSHLTAEEFASVLEGLSILADLNYKELGALLSADAGMGFKYRNFGVSMRMFSNSGVTPILDLDNIGLGLSIPEGYGGILLGDGSGGTLNLDQQDTAQVISEIISITDTADDLASVLGYIPNPGFGSLPDQLANAIVDMAVEAGAMQVDLDELAAVVREYLPNIADLLKLAGKGSYADNTTQILVDAAAFAELALGYAVEPLPGFQVGANFKIIQGYVAQTGIMLFENREDIVDILKDAFNDKKESNSLGIDVGVLLNFRQFLDMQVPFNPQFGFTARNINTPKFDRPVPYGISTELHWKTSKYELEPQLRAGVSVNPFKFMTLAADLDLTCNKTSVNNFPSRQFALGLEVNVVNGRKFNLPLRLGMNKNVSSPESATMFTGGFGLNMMHFQMEFAGGISGRTTTVDGHKLPASLAASLALSVLF